MPKITDQQWRDYIAKCNRLIPTLSDHQLEFAKKRKSNNELLIFPIGMKQLQVPIKVAEFKCNLTTFRHYDFQMRISKDPPFPISSDDISLLTDDELHLIAKRIEQVQQECKEPKIDKQNSDKAIVEEDASCPNLAISYIYTQHLINKIQEIVNYKSGDIVKIETKIKDLYAGKLITDEMCSSLSYMLKSRVKHLRLSVEKDIQNRVRFFHRPFMQQVTQNQEAELQALENEIQKFREAITIPSSEEIEEVRKELRGASISKSSSLSSSRPRKIP